MCDHVKLGSYFDLLCVTHINLFKNELGNTIAFFDGKVILSKVEQNDSQWSLNRQEHTMSISVIHEASVTSIVKHPEQSILDSRNPQHRLRHR